MLARVLVTVVLSYAPILVNATPYILHEPSGQREYIQGEIATSEEICTLLKNHVFSHMDHANQKNVPPFRIPDETIAAYLRGIPKNVQMLYIVDNTKSLVLRNVKGCADTLNRENSPAFQFLAKFSAQMVSPRTAFVRYQLEGNDQSSRFQFFVMLLGLRETHLSLERVFNESDQKLISDDRRAEEQHAHDEESARLKSIEAEKRRIDEERLAARKELDRQEWEKALAVKTKELQVAKDRQDRVNFAISLVAAVMFTAGALFFSSLYFRVKINKEREDTLHSISA